MILEKYENGCCVSYPLPVRVLIFQLPIHFSQAAILMQVFHVFNLHINDFTFVDSNPSFCLKLSRRHC